jgi:leucyl aminopeptidase
MMKKQIQEMGMLALWSVGKGSATPPRFIHLTYKPEGEPKDRVAFVGKGLTFDSGGLNIKTGDYMRTMKMDKAGACTVLGIMKAVAQFKAPSGGARDHRCGGEHAQRNRIQT